MPRATPPAPLDTRLVELVALVQLTATDTGLSLGDGPEVRGTALSLLMAVSGRRVALNELDGPGVVTLTGQRTTS